MDISKIYEIKENINISLNNIYIQILNNLFYVLPSGNSYSFLGNWAKYG